MTTSVSTEVSQLYVAMFGRAPDSEGLAYWGDLLQRGLSMAQVGDAMFATSPARTYFPYGLSNSEIVSSFYLNVLGRSADSEGLAYWTNKLNAHGATAGSVISEMIGVITNYAGSDPAGLTSAALFNNRCAAAEYFGNHGGTTAHAASVIAGVTADAVTVIAARTLTIPGSLPSPTLVAVDAGGFDKVSLEMLNSDLYISNLASGAEIHVLNSDADSPSSFHVFCVAADAHAGSSLTVAIAAPLFADFFFTGEADVSIENSLENDFARVGIAGDVLQRLELSGTGEIDFTGVAADSVDATGMGHSMSLYASTVGTLTGSANADVIFAETVTGEIDGGPGNDSLLVGSGPAVGGPGADLFVPLFNLDGNSMIVRDFVPGVDSLSLTSISETPHAAIWRSNPITFPASANFQSYIDAACAFQVSDTCIVSWFNFSGNTYVVVDNDVSTHFVQGMDQVVELTGVFDLSNRYVGSLLLH